MSSFLLYWFWIKFGVLSSQTGSSPSPYELVRVQLHLLPLAHDQTESSLIQIIFIMRRRTLCSVPHCLHHLETIWVHDNWVQLKGLHASVHRLRLVRHLEPKIKFGIASTNKIHSCISNHNPGFNSKQIFVKRGFCVDLGMILTRYRPDQTWAERSRGGHLVLYCVRRDPVDFRVYWCGCRSTFFL